IHRLDASAQPPADLLGQIDAMSSVSGGSLASAYYALHAKELRSADADAKLWRDYLDLMALNYHKRELLFQTALNPLTLLKLSFTNYNRGRTARDDYDATLFKPSGRSASLADLPERPALYLNAFDVTNRVRFVFSKHYLDT